VAARAAAIGWQAGPAPVDRGAAGRPAIESAADSALIAEFLHSGSHPHFEVLVRRYKDRVHRLLASILGPGFAGEAEDLTQEVFVRVYHKLSGFRRQSRFQTWLYRLAFRIGIDAKRKARHRYPHDSDEALAERTATGSAEDPLSGTLDREARRALRAAVEGLGEPARTAIHLYYWMECPIVEIATYLDMRPGTVKSHLFRARERLARLLDAAERH
jgi:RNA polymerase sigma-70 factor (ECF subfamily)